MAWSKKMHGTICIVSFRENQYDICRFLRSQLETLELATSRALAVDHLY